MRRIRFANSTRLLCLLVTAVTITSYSCCSASLQDVRKHYNIIGGGRVNMNNNINKLRSRRRPSRGVIIDFGHLNPSNGNNNSTLYHNDQHMSSGEKIQLTISPGSAWTLLRLLFISSSTFMNACVGTLRLLAPLIVARRVIVSIGHFIVDYMTGRYFRKTYTRLERMYLTYYETPAALRSIARSGSQILSFVIIQRIMSWLVGVDHPPCCDGKGLNLFCGMIWIGSILGVGHATSAAVAVWGGPLRIQASQHNSVGRGRRRSVSRVFTRPWHILQWMQNPDEWLSTLSLWSFEKQGSVAEPFVPNRLLFPATWAPLRLLQIFTMAKVRCQYYDQFLIIFLWSLSRSKMCLFVSTRIFVCLMHVFTFTF